MFGRKFYCVAALFIVAAGPATSASAQQAAKFSPVKLTAEQVNTVQRGVRKSLKDPESARFGGFAAAAESPNAITVCGVVNAKNSYGGYTGNQPFIGLLFGKSYLVGKIGGSQQEAAVVITMCRQRGMDVR
ncbi:hypothetical protein [Neorhizobium alkalisoli]|uniref:Uncharacterized protein n=1 Tax=Neorhizobium alkalisoli TaxID=528178 RepID=A0A561QSK5_9HYPH|nr:hypothetical protein [Neorhizobium alkalisoli]TWF53266.1 hypothetical protein FHW37_104543 [Neorhizobium alkalisoli]